MTTWLPGLAHGPIARLANDVEVARSGKHASAWPGYWVVRPATDNALDLSPKSD